MDILLKILRFYTMKLHKSMYDTGFLAGDENFRETWDFLLVGFILSERISRAVYLDPAAHPSAVPFHPSTHQPADPVPSVVMCSQPTTRNSTTHTIAHDHYCGRCSRRSFRSRFLSLYAVSNPSVRRQQVSM